MQKFSPGGLIKAQENGIVEGYLVPFTDPEARDFHGEYFDRNTEISFDPATAPVMYQHGEDPNVGATVLGKFLDYKVTDLGVWARAQLDMTVDAARKVYRLAKRGLIGWSSGAKRDALVDRNGKIHKWNIREGSLTRFPAMPFATLVTAKSAHQNVPCLKELLAEEGEDEEDAPIAANDVTYVKNAGTLPGYRKESRMDALSIVAAIAKRMGAKLSGEDLASIAAEISGVAPAEAEVVAEADPALMGAEADPTRSAPVKSAADVLAGLAADRIRTSQSLASADLFEDVAERALAAGPRKNVEGSARNAVGGAHSAPVGTSGRTPYSGGAPANIANLSIKRVLDRVSDNRLSFAFDMNAMLKRIGSTARVRFATRREDEQQARNIAKSVFAAKVAEAYESGKSDMNPQHYEKALSMARNFSKANELDYTTQSGYGDTWVPETWSNQIWPRARRENVVLSRVSSFEMTAPIMNWPTDGSDGEVFMVSEATGSADFNDPVTAANVGKIPTSEVVFNTGGKKLLRQVGWTREELEDSIIKFDSQADDQAMRSMLDAFDYVILNGDTETGTTNINYDDGTPASNKAYLIWDGIIKYALANTGVDMGTAAPTYKKLVEMLYKMNSEIAGDEKDTVIFTHAPVYGQFIQLDEFVGADVVGGPGANTTGLVKQIAGVPVLRTQQILKSATNGKVNDTGGSNLYGRAVGVYLPYWKLGYRRRIGRKLAESGDGETFMLTMTARASFKQHSNASGAAILYGIGI